MITVESIPAYVCYAAVCSKGEACTACECSKKTRNQKWLSERTEEDMLLVETCMEEAEEWDPKNTQANGYLKQVLTGKAVIAGRIVDKQLMYSVKKEGK